MTVRDRLTSLPLARQLTVDRHGLSRAAQFKRSRHRAGFQSARDPKYTVAPQRRRERDRSRT